MKAIFISLFILIIIQVSAQTEKTKDTIIIEFENNITLNKSYTDKKCDKKECTYYFYIYDSPKFEEGATYSFKVKKHKCLNRRKVNTDNKTILNINYFYYNYYFGGLSRLIRNKDITFLIKEKNKKNFKIVYDYDIIMEIE